MEILVRMAYDKFIRGGNIKSYVEALKLAFENHFIPYFKQFDSSKFRRERLWNEECDNTFERFSKVLTALYSKYSGRLALPGAHNYICLEEFIEMIELTGIINDKFSIREISPFFNLAMMT